MALAMNRITCVVCKRDKYKKEFRQNKEECRSCEHKVEEADRKAAVADRKKEREGEKRALSLSLKKQRKDRFNEQRRIDRLAQKKLTVKSQHEREIIRRTLVRNNLIHFVQRFVPNYQAGWLHHDVCRRLEQFLKDVVAGTNPRLMLFTPPRHGKSEIASKKFPAWALGKYPWLEIIAASYAVSLPQGFSRSVRATLRDTAYQNVFPDTHLDPEYQNVEGWMTTAGGIFIPAGVGGGITGKGANILIIDDPIKDAEEADSETVRESTWDWYGSTAYTRLAPLSGVLIIQCMTGDTPVLMDDLTEKRLDKIQAGDLIKSWDKGLLVTARVRDQRSNGDDKCFKITMSSGKIIQANARHPFLTGDLKWTRLQDWGKWKGVKCSEEDCDKPVRCRGYCQSHYNKVKWASGNRPPSSKKDSESRISAKLKHRYGITFDDYKNILDDQNGLCAICERFPEDCGNPKHWNSILCVDHDHDSGRVRGLLCNHCNLFLKHRNTISTLHNAIDYINRTNRVS